MEWNGMEWNGMLCYAMLCYAMVWYGMVWYGMVWYGMVWYVCMYVCMYVCVYVYIYIYIHILYTPISFIESSSMPCACCLNSAVLRRYQELLPPWAVILINGLCAYPPVLSRIFERKMGWNAVALQCHVATHDLCSQLKVQAIRTLESLAENAQEGSGIPLCLSVLPLPIFCSGVRGEARSSIIALGGAKMLVGLLARYSSSSNSLLKFITL